jgi:hypothetical protein
MTTISGKRSLLLLTRPPCWILITLWLLGSGNLPGSTGSSDAKSWFKAAVLAGPIPWVKSS